MRLTSQRIQFLFLFLGLFVFRTFFGLSHFFYGHSEIDNDALQTYLIGLKSYTTGTWPYFGPDQYDLNSGFHFQIAGALEGLVIGLPFYLLPIPEAPFLFLNLLSLSAIAMLSFYFSRRFSNLSMPFIFAWTALLPWTLNQSTHVFNVSYLLSGSILFFIGFFESVPEFSVQWFSPFWAFALMGFGLFWDMQFHQSWVLLPPFVFGVFAWRRISRAKRWGSEVLGSAAGALLPLACLVPTLLNYGFLKPGGGLAHAAMGFRFCNFKLFLTILARYLSLPSFEMPRFMGAGTGERMAFLKQIPFIIPPAIFLTLAGWIEPFILLGYPWFKEGRTFQTVRFYGLVLSSFLMVWVCFWFVNTDPAAHMYYVLFPLVTIYSFSIWNQLALKPVWKVLGMACLIAGVWFQSGFAFEKIKNDSIYADRPRIVKAIQARDYRILSERRPWVLY